MDWGSIVAGLVGLTAFGVGVFGLRKASESNRIAQKAFDVAKESHDFQVAEVMRARRANLEIAGMEVVYTNGSPEPLLAIPSVKVIGPAEARKVRLDVFNNGIGYDSSNPPIAVVGPGVSPSPSFKFPLDSVELPAPRAADRFRLVFTYEDDEGEGKQVVECVRFGESDGYWLHGPTGTLYAQRLDCGSDADIPWPWQ